jgi:hypothetical protein
MLPQERPRGDDSRISARRCLPIDRLSVPARNGAEIAKAALGQLPEPPFFRDPESTIQNAADENPREDDRGRGNAEIVDAACAWRPRHYFVGLLKAGQIDQGLLRLAISHLTLSRPLWKPASRAP